MKDIIKDRDEQPYEDVRRSGGVLNAGVSVPIELGFTIPPVCVCVHQPGSFPTPYYWDFCRGSILSA